MYNNSGWFEWTSQIGKTFTWIVSKHKWDYLQILLYLIRLVTFFSLHVHVCSGDSEEKSYQLIIDILKNILEFFESVSEESTEFKSYGGSICFWSICVDWNFWRILPVDSKKIASNNVVAWILNTNCLKWKYSRNSKNLTRFSEHKTYFSSNYVFNSEFDFN